MSEILGPEKLAKIRAKVLKTLPETAQISRSVKQSDGRGNYTETRTIVGSVPCRLITMSYDQERVYEGRLQNKLGYKVLLPFGTNLKDSDKLIITGREFDIIDIMTGQTWQIFIEAILTTKR